MLTITVGDVDGFDEDTQRFVTFGGYTVHLEHSLISLSKWEELHEKSFLSSEKTDEEMLDYIRCMILPGTRNPDVLHLLSAENIREITEYLQAKKTATTFVDGPDEQKQKNEKITSEQIYSWMAAHQIDWRAENWHVNRLLTLIRICNINASKDSKKNTRRVTGSSAMANRRALNQARRAQSGSTG